MLNCISCVTCSPDYTLTTWHLGKSYKQYRLKSADEIEHPFKEANRTSVVSYGFHAYRHDMFYTKMRLCHTQISNTDATLKFANVTAKWLLWHQLSSNTLWSVSLNNLWRADLHTSSYPLSQQESGHPKSWRFLSKCTICMGKAKL